jgi:hypothetical protein
MQERIVWASVPACDKPQRKLKEPADGAGHRKVLRKTLTQPTVTNWKHAYTKATWRFLSFLFLCYVAAYLDRVNVDFDKLQMLNDLRFARHRRGDSHTRRSACLRCRVNRWAAVVVRIIFAAKKSSGVCSVGPAQQTNCGGGRTGQSHG